MTYWQQELSLKYIISNEYERRFRLEPHGIIVNQD